ncbi:Endonuclease/exonuclease/phosphatase [Coniella lustricola]|uniref:CCR4-Not complex 3'-5'-exoribonuclease subunit Ccr4 n=1 Tax=Coniella lustricola TaxID=2025994 RepID=A0A2T3A5Q4_9PEZI|nr:Endonuclease/exonuclease/phosphatase [Coniella lustricola]
MADGYRYLQQHLGNVYVQPTPKNSLADQTLLHTLLSHVQPSPLSTPKPSDRASPSRSAQGMYSTGHQPGPNSRLNGGNNAASRSMQMLYNHPSNASNQYTHPGHHQGIQPDHTGHGASMGHASGYSSGIIPSASPYSSNNIPNGHPGTTRGGQAQQISEEWALQLRLHKEAERAHASMSEQHSGHYFARLKAAENRGIGPSLGSASTSNVADAEDDQGVRRPHTVEKVDQRQEWFNMDMSGQGVRHLSPDLFDHYAFLKELYLASNKLSHIPAALGQLRKLTLLELSHNQITEVPPELGMCTSLKQLFLFDNQIQTLPYEMGSLFNLDVLGIEGNPLDAELKQELMEKGTKSLISFLREQAKVPLPPNPRPIIVLNEETPPSLERVKVLTWNILCEKYSTQNIYGYTPSSALTWEFRKDGILQEIRERDADFVCLQEVSVDAMREVFSPELATSGYKGVQFSRTKAKVMYDKEANAVDGCAVFYKAKKFILLDKQVIDFSTIAINRPDMKTHHDIFNRVMPKDNIGMICFFESRQTGARMIVANAHLAWEPELADVKLIQTAILMENVTKFGEKYARWPACRDKKFIQLAADEDASEALLEPQPSQEYRSNTDIPLVVCGDYNSPGDSSVYELLSKGRVAPDNPDFGGRQYGAFTRDGIEHPFHLRSTYSALDGTPDEMPFTNYVPTFNGVIDYIWYSSNSLEVLSLLGPPDMEYLRRVPGFPHYHFPSDHLHIMAEVAIKARKDKKTVPESEFSNR